MASYGSTQIVFFYFVMKPTYLQPTYLRPRLFVGEALNG